MPNPERLTEDSRTLFTVVIPAGFDEFRLGEVSHEHLKDIQDTIGELGELHIGQSFDAGHNRSAI